MSKNTERFLPGRISERQPEKRRVKFVNFTRSKLQRKLSGPQCLQGERPDKIKEVGQGAYKEQKGLST